MTKTFTNVKHLVRTTANKAYVKAKNTLSSIRGEGYVDTGVKILISVVIGALLLSSLYGLFNTTIMPKVTEKITALFNYTA